MTTSQLLMNQKRFVDSGPYQWMVELRMLMCKLKALILNATISSHWWGKWYKGQLRMKLKVNSVVKEVLFNAYWLYRRNHCLQTLFLLFECVTRETRESFTSRTYVLLAGKLISIGDVRLSKKSFVDLSRLRRSRSAASRRIGRFTAKKGSLRSPRGRLVASLRWCQPEYRYGQYTLCHRLCKSVRTVRIL